MLSKLLKYEFKSTARILIPSYILIILYSIVCRLFDWLSSKLEILQTPSVLLYIFYVFLIFGVIVLTFIVILQQFYKNLIGDEGYLMFTIPVEPYKHIITKLLTAIVWTVSSVIIAILSLIVLIITPDIFDIVMNYIKNISADVWYFGIRIAIIIIFSGIASILMIYASISLGQLITGHKIVGSIVSYLALYILNQIISTIAIFVISYMFPGSFNNSNIMFNSNLINTLTIFISGINIIMGSAYFFAINYIFKNKLNLE